MLDLDLARARRGVHLRTFVVRSVPGRRQMTVILIRCRAWEWFPTVRYLRCVRALILDWGYWHCTIYFGRGDHVG